MNIIGYVTLYIRVDYEDYPEYIEHSFDFTKPLTKQVLEEILGITKTSLKRMGRNPIGLNYVTREEYMAKKIGKVYCYKWGDLKDDEERF